MQLAWKYGIDPEILFRAADRDNRYLKPSSEEGVVQITIMDVDHMCGTQFEEFVVKLLEWSGYLVERHSDLGADIIAINGNKKIAFQAKRHKSNIGVAAIQEVYSGSKYYDCSHAVVITNSGFTPKAVQMARKLNVQLIGRDELVIILRTGKIISND